MGLQRRVIPTSKPASPLSDASSATLCGDNPYKDVAADQNLRRMRDDTWMVVLLGYLNERDITVFLLACYNRLARDTGVT